MRNGVLNSHRLHLFRMNKSHTKSNGAAIVLHEEGVPIQLQLAGDVLHQLCKMVECVGKLSGMRPG